LRSSGLRVKKSGAKSGGTAHAAFDVMDEELDPLTRRIIGCAIEVHRFLGPGLLESIYRSGLAVELRHSGLAFDRERRIGITYRGVMLGEFHPDFVVQDEVIVEVKSASAHDRVFDAQVLTYMRLTGHRTGLLLNFGRPVLKDGLKRFRL
jgi:GxxExxY protein